MAGVILKEKLTHLEIGNRSVVLDVRTRWNSMYLMVARFVEIYPGLCAAARDPRLKNRVDKDKVEKLSDADLQKAEEFVETMKILYTSTLAVSSDKLPTIVQVLPTWNKLQVCFKVQENDSEFVKLIKTVVWQDMQKRYQYEDVLHFLEEASALDPRFKNKSTDEVWGRLESKVSDLIQAATVPVQEIKSTIKVEPGLTDAKPSQCTTEDQEGSSDEDIEIAEPVLKKKKSAIEELFDDDDDDITITKIDDPPTPQMLAHSQIEQYKNMQKIRSSENPLDFYKAHSASKFPMVAALACQYFWVSGSSVPSERVFSLAGNTISQERVRICPEKADMLIFLHKNAA